MKIYKIKFNYYQIIADDDGIGTYVRHNTMQDDAIKIKSKMFLIKEDDIEKFRNYGNGISSLEYVGDFE